jgi:AcrR family transcriptional regulator
MVSERKALENGKTREIILDATETIMLEEGYAAVSSRRVATTAGLKSQLVHYHFGTMDDLFLALFQRAETQYFDRHLRAVASSKPLRELWELSIDRSGMGLIFEFMALANHRETIRKEIARANVRTRSMRVALLTRALEESGVALDICPPNVLSLLIAGAALQLVIEEAIGVSTAHADTLVFIEQLIQKIEQGRLPVKASSAKKPPAKSPLKGTAEKTKRRRRE